MALQLNRLPQLESFWLNVAVLKHRSWYSTHKIRTLLLHAAVSRYLFLWGSLVSRQWLTQKHRETCGADSWRQFKKTNDSYNQNLPVKCCYISCVFFAWFPWNWKQNRSWQAMSEFSYLGLPSLCLRARLLALALSFSTKLAASATSTVKSSSRTCQN